METSTSDYKNQNEEKMKRSEIRTSGRFFSGMIVIAIGGVLLAKQIGVIFPHWFFNWPMILIVIGLYVGARHGFRLGGWIVPIIIGSVGIVDDVLPGFSFHDYIWPIMIIGLGLFLMFRPRNYKKDWPGWSHKGAARSYNSASTEDFIDSVSVFGGTKKNIISKDFKGGDVVIFFGGMELNLSQADLTGPVQLELTQFFGGTKLIVPSNWKIRSEVVTVFGSFEDKRNMIKDTPDTEKVLIIHGTCVFGGIDVKSY